MSYVLIRVYSFECDGCGELAGDVVPRHNTGLRAARAELGRTGWTFNSDGDRCPDCSRKGPE